VPKAFEIADELQVDATPEQVWDAIGTGRGWDSWFMGRNEVEATEGGLTRFSLGGFTQEAALTAWEPPTHFRSRSAEAPDGGFHQFEYRVEGREDGPTTIRYVHSGVLGGDDWEREYEAMGEGDPAYFRKLVEYLTYFRGRYATPISAFGPNVGDRDDTMAVFRQALGVPQDAGLGDRVRIEPDGLAPSDGVLDEVTENFLGVRSDDAMYRFIHGFEGSTILNHHLFSEGVDQAAEEAAWSAWLQRTFAQG
jgi:uncharacterized protein YndB with AHSA1/START domain